jgi:two-component system, NarL family, sensor kinase
VGPGSWNPPLFAGGEFDGYIGSCVDITSRKKVEEELEQRVKERTTELELAEQTLRALSGRLLQMQNEERRRIARELHDSAGQILTALNLNLVPVAEKLTSLGADLAEPVRESIVLINELSKELRTLSHLLQPPLLDEAGLPSAIRWFMEGFAEPGESRL